MQKTEGGRKLTAKVWFGNDIRWWWWWLWCGKVYEVIVHYAHTNKNRRVIALMNFGEKEPKQKDKI